MCYDAAQQQDSTNFYEEEIDDGPLIDETKALIPADSQLDRQCCSRSN